MNSNQDDNYIVVDQESNLIQNNNAYKHLKKKILIRTMFTIIRLFFLLIFFYFDNTLALSAFIKPLVQLLILHESIILFNFFQMITVQIVLRLSNTSIERSSSYAMKIIEMTDILANVLFFAFYIWGNYLFLIDKQGVMESLKYNKFITYYITFIILLGYFIYSRLIFVILFFILFSPCILYNVIDRLLTKTRLQRLRDNLPEEQYSNYTKRTNAKVDQCSICLFDFKEYEKVTGLSCSNMHLYHTSCIKESIESRNFYCPLCRSPLDTDHLSVSSENE